MTASEGPGSERGSARLRHAGRRVRWSCWDAVSLARLWFAHFCRNYTDFSLTALLNKKISAFFWARKALTWRENGWRMAGGPEGQTVGSYVRVGSWNHLLRELSVCSNDPTCTRHLLNFHSVSCLPLPPGKRELAGAVAREGGQASEKSVPPHRLMSQLLLPSRGGPLNIPPPAASHSAAGLVAYSNSPSLPDLVLQLMLLMSAWVR